MEKEFIPDLAVTRKTKKRIAKERVFRLSELLEKYSFYEGISNNTAWRRAVVA